MPGVAHHNACTSTPAPAFGLAPLYALNRPAERPAPRERCSGALRLVTSSWPSTCGVSGARLSAFLQPNITHSPPENHGVASERQASVYSCAPVQTSCFAVGVLCTGPRRLDTAAPAPAQVSHFKQNSEVPGPDPDPSACRAGVESSRTPGSLARALSTAVLLASVASAPPTPLIHQAHC